MTPIYEQTINCPVCGKQVEQTGKGRPREYHEKCRQFAKQLSWLENIISDPSMLPRTQHVKTLVKSNLTRLQNLTNGWQVTE
jgi:hypothetical protein